MVLRELVERYQDLDAPIAPLGLSFRDYVIEKASLADETQRQRDRAYWLKRLESLPPAPALPVVSSPTGQARFRRQVFELDRRAWGDLRAGAARRNISPSTAVLTAYAGTVAAWSRSPCFTLNLTLQERLALHPDVDKVIGDFTTLELLEVDWTRRRT